MFALGATLSACGGGGGGSAPIPGGGNGGSTPTPVPTGHPTSSPTNGTTPTPSPAPTHSPTPAPTHSPTPSPTASPTQSPQGRTMLPDTTGRIGLIQVLDDYYSGTPAMTSSQIASEAPYIDSVWGSFFPSTWRSANPSVILSRYFTIQEDQYLISGHNLQWWQTNHPDWMLYSCDANGNPTKQLAWPGTMFGNVPLAFYLPQVEQYEMSLEISYMQANGYNAIAIDNTNVTNPTVDGNPNFTSWPGYNGVDYNGFGCGTYDSSGNFHQRYSSKSDPQYTTDLIAWMSAATGSIHGAGLKVIANHPINGDPTNSTELQIISYADAMLDEAGYTHYGEGPIATGSAFDEHLQWFEYLQSHNQAALLTEYTCATSSCSNDPSSISGQTVDFLVASYALSNEGGQDVYISPHQGSVPIYRPEYSNKYGSPCSGYTQVSSYVYVRRFSGGLAIVNVSGGAYTYTLPSSHSYSDLEGRAVSSSLTVNNQDGYMLLTTGNGCS